MPSLPRKKRKGTPAAAAQAEIEELRRRLEEAEETLQAIRTGAVDALVVEESSGHRIYTLEGADRSYRLFVEEMEQGAATLHADGTIAWSNRQLGLLLKTPSEKLIGLSLRDFISPAHQLIYDPLLEKSRMSSGRAEVELRCPDGSRVPVFLTFNALPADCGSAIGVLVTDLTPQLHHQRLTAAHAALRESQRQLALVADIAPVFIAHCDQETRYRFVNEPYAKRLGLTPEECVGKRIADVLGEESSELLRPYYDLALSGSSVEFELEIPYANLGRHFMHCSYAPEFDADGRVMGFVAAVTDITERRRVELALRNSEQQLRAIYDGTSEFIGLLSPEGVLLEANRASLAFAGNQREEVVQRLFWETAWFQFTPGAPEVIRQLFQRAVQGEVVSTELALNKPSGETFHFEVIFSPIRGENGEVVLIVPEGRDISVRKNAEVALLAAQTELEKHARELERRVAERTADLQATNEQLEAFVHSIAHDLRSPLRSMAGFSRLLLDQHAGGLNEKGQGFLKHIQASSEFLDKLLLDLLAYGRTARAEIEIGQVDVRKVWADAVAQMSQPIEETNAIIEVKGPLPWVHAHEATLGQCLANLLSNALKFIAPGAQPRIRFHAEDQPGASQAPGEARVRLWVEDNGIGIAPELQERAFRVFERLHGARYSGTGVGLSIVRKGAERMGGKVGVISAPGHGSRFWIELTRADGVGAWGRGALKG